jgi:hypothetical protein
VIADQPAWEIVFVIERKVDGKWRVVANGIEAGGIEAASVAVARAAEGEGLYRATSLGPGDPPVTFQVPAYGLPVPVRD